jgi:hypothetical protein
MRTTLMILVLVSWSGETLAQAGADAAEEPTAPPEQEPAATATDDDASGAPVVINGDTTLVINGDVTIAAPSGDLALAPAAAPSAAGRPGPPDPERPIRILAVYTGEVKLDVGAQDGVQAGDRFAVFRQRTVETEGDEQFEGEELIAVIEVSAVAEQHAVAELWKGDRVSETDVVRPATGEESSSHVYPRRLSHLGEVSLVLRPLLAVGSTSGFGGLADLTVAYFTKRMFVDVRMQPLGFGWTEDGNIVSASFVAEGGYDGRAFALGLGVGASVVNGDIDEMLENSSIAGASAMEDGETAEPVDWKQRTRAAFTISQQVRLGARDGLHMTVYNLLMYHRDDSGDGQDDSGMIYAGTAGKVVVPLAARTFLFVEGGGGLMGYGFGDVGVFTWVRGAGDAGSVGISALAGGAGVWGVRSRKVPDGAGGEYEQTEEISIAGPLVGVGLTYRFGFR